MSAPHEVRVPDLGTDEKVEVVEVLVAAGQEVAIDDGLITLESDKATMDVPSPVAGKVVKIHVKVGDRVGEGDPVLSVEAVGEAVETPPRQPPPTSRKAGAEEAEAGAEKAAAGEPRTAAGGPAAAPEPGPAAPPQAGAGPEGAETGPVISDERPAAAAGAGAGTGAAAAVAEVAESEAPDREPAPAPTAVAELSTEVLVLGAGPGGYTAAFRAADLGKKVVLVERDATLGGVCLNVGCIPSKALLHVARVVEEAADLGEHGVAFGEPRFDLEKLRAWKDGVIGKLTGGLAALAKQRKVTVVRGTGRFTGPRSLAVETEDGPRAIAFESAIVAAGSRPMQIPGIPSDDPRVMDSTGALALADVPDRLLVVGGGIIGLEMATVYAALGSKITVVELLDGLIPGCDRDLVKPLERRLTQRLGAEIHVKTKVTRVEAGEKELVAHLEGEGAPESAAFDRVLVAVGRRPNSDALGLDAAGVTVDERGFVPVDNRMRTNVAHIYAIGDLVGNPMLAHKASHEGKVAAEVAAGEKSAFDARAIPSVAYTDPEIAWVGLTETDAKASGAAYERAAFPWSASGRALGMGRGEGLTKILFDPETKRVLGAGVVGPSAGDLIAELTLALEMGCEAADLGLTIHPHPTLSETVAFAAEAFEGTLTDLYLPRKR